MILHHHGASVAPDPFKDLPSGSATIVGDSQCTSIWIIVPCYIEVLYNLLPVLSATTRGWCMRGKLTKSTCAGVWRSVFWSERPPCHGLGWGPMSTHTERNILLMCVCELGGGGGGGREKSAINGLMCWRVKIPVHKNKKEESVNKKIIENDDVDYLDGSSCLSRRGCYGMEQDNSSVTQGLIK